MKDILKRNLIDPIEGFTKWQVEELTLEGTELIEKLKNYFFIFKI